LCADPFGLLLLDEARAAKASPFVTDDAALLGLQAVESMEIASPRRFWEKMKKA
jgi:predicted nucleic acid-binding protein